MNLHNTLRRWWLPPLIGAILCSPTFSRAQAPAIDPEAIRLLGASTDYVAALNAFRIETVSSVELITADQEKLQFDHQVEITVKRPDRMRVDRTGELISQSIYYDGKTLTLSLPEDGYYATVHAPGTIDAMLDFARNQLDVVAPGADLIYSNAFRLLTDRLTSAKVLGEAIVAGVRTNHLAFRNPEVDWQIWIQQGDKPVPRQLVITSKKMPQAPDFSVVITKWDIVCIPAERDRGFRRMMTAESGDVDQCFRRMMTAFAAMSEIAVK